MMLEVVVYPRRAAVFRRKPQLMRQHSLVSYRFGSVLKVHPVPVALTKPATPTATTAPTLSAPTIQCRSMKPHLMVMVGREPLSKVTWPRLVIRQQDGWLIVGF